MKENKISVLINAPVSFVYDFTINRKNTHEWIKSIQKEETNEWPVKIGSIYRNTSDGKNWDEYGLTDLEENKLFKLEKKNSSYVVEYHYKEISPSVTELTYFEYEENLQNPFEQSVLGGLKVIIEERYKNQ